MEMGHLQNPPEMNISDQEGLQQDVIAKKDSQDGFDWYVSFYQSINNLFHIDVTSKEII